jgi:hypothetical protein
MRFNLGDTTAHPILHGLRTMPELQRTSTSTIFKNNGCAPYLSIRNDGYLAAYIDHLQQPKQPKRVYRSKKQVHVTAEYNRSAVYLLFNEDELVYVGQSVKPLQRIGQHQREKTFDSYRILYCAENRRLYWESKLINALRPKLNRTLR